MNAILSVSQINTYISLKLKNDPKLRGIAIKGEISNLSQSSRAGHIYFSLRDQNAVIKAVMFARDAARLRFQPFNGMAAIVFGSVEVYERDGVYQIIATQLLPDGAGNEYLALQKLKEKLMAMGVFDAEKRPIARYPQKIAVVTSPTGAAWQDVKNIVARRYPKVVLELFPTLVQGAQAPENIAKAIQNADRSGADTIILTRGGGSTEDLSAFNTELVVMAVYNSETPLISAVGHEIDWSLCDLAADLRAPTPSGAAELATPDIAQMKNELKSMQILMRHLASAKLSACREHLKKYEYALASNSVKEKITMRRRELKSIGDAIESAASQRLRVSKITLDSLREVLESLSPQNVLNRGYALVYSGEQLATGVDKLASGQEIRVIMQNGSVDATVKRINITENGDENEV